MVFAIGTATRRPGTLQWERNRGRHQTLKDGEPEVPSIFFTSHSTIPLKSGDTLLGTDTGSQAVLDVLVRSILQDLGAARSNKFFSDARTSRERVAVARGGVGACGPMSSSVGSSHSS